MKKNALIFVVAYHAEAHLADVFRRIPIALLPEGCEILVIDDGSQDATFEVAREEARTCPIPARAWKNPRNLGYGGNQKLGYQTALREGFQAVVLLHGDGQYAPELLPEMLAPALQEGVDVVLGSRMLRKQDALSGGMPLYKWVGNQILTAIENRIVGSRLSEFHTGYRTYRAEALRKIPFAQNTNAFHFDTEILIQLLRTRASIREIPIPTHYGDEVCRVKGWRYFFDCLRACCQDWLTEKGLFYCRRFDLSPPEDRYESKLDCLHSSHQIAVRLVPEGTRVLDIGGGNAWVADRLALAKHCDVIIVDRHFREPSHGAPHRRIPFDISGDLAVLTLPEAEVILLLDVIEHLPRPRHVALLDALRNAYDDPPATFILSVPNTAFLPLRLVFFALGRLNYGSRGILDETHAFLFTVASLRELMEECGYDIVRWHQTPAPYELALGHTPAARWLSRLHAVAARLCPSLFAYQFLLETRPRPTVETLLKHATSRPEEG